ncbi:paramyosin, short form-like [Frieseomelitta varia]|uniref:paramyosin, short form-like n=1 Tax=Frieseomelitta varia TaxID=561572 RepID=UPI001CB6B2C0|nr:paramyosin, short form-like [Frieseomelitta varia]
MQGPTPLTYVSTKPRWKHWPTYIYDKDYSYGVNFYQPMPEYIDRQGRNFSLSSDYRSHRSQLPWSDGRALWENRPVETYPRRELISRAIDAEDEARDHLSHFKIANRSNFSFSKVSEASHVTREIFPRKPEEIKPPSNLLLLVESARVKSAREREMANINMRSLRDVQTIAEIEEKLNQGQSLRGKSARAIGFHLTAESLKKLNRSQELADIRKKETASANYLLDSRDRLRILEEKTRYLDEDDLTAPLNSLSRELKGYEEKSSNYFLDKRYRHPTRPRRLYGCLGIRPA